MLPPPRPPPPGLVSDGVSGLGDGAGALESEGLLPGSSSVSASASASALALASEPGVGLAPPEAKYRLYACKWRIRGSGCEGWVWVNGGACAWCVVRAFCSSFLCFWMRRWLTGVMGENRLEGDRFLRDGEKEVLPLLGRTKGAYGTYDWKRMKMGRK